MDMLMMAPQAPLPMSSFQYPPHLYGAGEGHATQQNNSNSNGNNDGNYFMPFQHHSVPADNHVAGAAATMMMPPLPMGTPPGMASTALGGGTMGGVDTTNGNGSNDSNNIITIDGSVGVGSLQNNNNNNHSRESTKSTGSHGAQNVGPTGGSNLAHCA